MFKWFGFWMLMPFVIGAVLVYRAERDHARVQLMTMAARAEAAEAARDRWMGAAKTCSDATAKAAQDAKAVDESERKREKDAVAIAQSAAMQAARRVLSMKTAEIPQACEGAVRWGNSQAAELGRWR